MAVESNHNKASEVKVEWNFPCLAEGKAGTIVFFYKNAHGIVVGKQKLGMYCENWDMSMFTPLSPSESITLRNV